MKISRSPFGKVYGADVYLFTITNKQGSSVKITNYGATITSIVVADLRKQLDDVVMGFDSIEGYLADQPKLGCICGRVANRISGASFTLDGRTYKLAANAGPNTLHGGISGFDKKIWQAEEFVEGEQAGVKMTYTSPDGEEGFPGNLTITLRYIFNNTNELKLFYSATTDKPTYVNLTNHSYFNLTGFREDVINHELMINSDKITTVTADLIPTGELANVEGTPFDFRKAKSISTDIAKTGLGYDQNFVLNKESDGLTLAATVYEQITGRVMEVFTSEPGIQLYTSNYLDGSLKGKKDIRYRKHFGLCLEAQHFPDSMHQPSFPSTLLKPGETYTQQTIYHFKTI
jgi:aldose 1-epimerase